MPSFSITLSHLLDNKAAKKQIRAMLLSLREKYPDTISYVRSSWHGNCCSFTITTSGGEINGTIVIRKHTVQVTGSIPMLLGFFKSKLEDLIRDEGREALSAN